VADDCVERRVHRRCDPRVLLRVIARLPRHTGGLVAGIEVLVDLQDPTIHKIILDFNGRPTPGTIQEPALLDPVSGYYNPSIPGRCSGETAPS